MNSIGERIRHSRKQRNLTGEVLAKLLGLQQSTISKLETGETAYPSVDYLFPLADALGVSARWLVTGVEPVGERDAAQQFALSEDIFTLCTHISTLEKDKLDAWFTLLGVRRT